MGVFSTINRITLNRVRRVTGRRHHLKLAGKKNVQARRIGEQHDFVYLLFAYITMFIEVLLSSGKREFVIYTY